MSLIGSPLILCLFLAADAEPAPKFPVGKETTYVTGPLDKEGYIDYEAALNDRLGKGVTPETNANVLLWKALGRRPKGAGMPAEDFKRMGIEPPPKDGEYFIGILQLLEGAPQAGPERVRRGLRPAGLGGKRPWTAKDYPHIAGWLEANEKPLALIVEATKRPDYFNPLISRRKQNRACIADQRLAPKRAEVP